MAHSASTHPTPTGPPPTGAALRRARELAELSVGGAARRLGVKPSTLRSWESGRVTPDEFQLDAAISLYGADLHAIWPDRTPLVHDDDPETLVVGDERIDLRVDEFGLRPDNRAVLVQYLAAVRRQRGVRHDATIELRGADLMALAAVLDLEDHTLESTLAELLDLTPAGSRFTMRALAVGALMAVGAATVVGGSWLAPNVGDAAAAPATAAQQVDEQDADQLGADQLVDDEASLVPVEISEHAAVEFAPDHREDADEVASESTTPASPFSTEPRAVDGAAAVEIDRAVFAVAPATESTPLDDGPFSVDPPEGVLGVIEHHSPTAPGELPPGSPR